MLRVVTLKRPSLSLLSVVTSAGQISAVMSDIYRKYRISYIGKISENCKPYTSNSLISGHPGLLLLL